MIRETAANYAFLIHYISNNDLMMRFLLLFTGLILGQISYSQDIHIGLNLSTRFYTQQSNTFTTANYLVTSTNATFSEHAMPGGIFTMIDFEGKLLRLELNYQYLNATSFNLYPSVGNQSTRFDQEYLNFLHENLSLGIQYMMPVDTKGKLGFYTSVNIDRYFMHNREKNRNWLIDRIEEEKARALSLDIFDSFRSYQFGYQTGIYTRPIDRLLVQLYFFNDFTSLTKRLDNGDFFTRFSGVGMEVSYSIFKLQCPDNKKKH